MRRLVLLLGLSLGVATTPTAEATTLESLAQASGGESSAQDQQGRVVIGETLLGRLSGPATTVMLGWLAGAADLTPPTGTLTINQDAVFTNTATVTLTLSASDDAGPVSQMRFSHDGLTYSSPEPYQTHVQKTLPSGDGLKTVHVQFRDAAGNWSPAASDQIVVDTLAPSVQLVSPKHGTLFGQAQ